MMPSVPPSTVCNTASSFSEAQIRLRPRDLNLASCRPEEFRGDTICREMHAKVMRGDLRDLANGCRE